MLKSSSNEINNQKKNMNQVFLVVPTALKNTCCSPYVVNTNFAL